MPVVQRPAAAPRRAQRRAAAAPELVLGAAAASNPAAQLVLGDAGEAAIADDAWSDNFGTAISVSQGYRCVRKKTDILTEDPLAPDHSMLSSTSCVKPRRGFARATLHARETRGSLVREESGRHVSRAKELASARSLWCVPAMSVHVV